MVSFFWCSIFFLKKEGIVKKFKSFVELTFKLTTERGNAVLTTGDEFSLTASHKCRKQKVITICSDVGKIDRLGKRTVAQLEYD